MRKIIMSLGMIVFAGALVAGATGAFFSDSETSTGNVFAAGAIDLSVDSEAHYAGLICEDGVWVLEDAETTRPDLQGQSCSGSWSMTDLGPTNTFFDLGDLKPGDEGENTISLHVDNNDAYVCAIIDNLTDDDNGLTEPEGDAGDTTAGDGQGELSQELRFFAWADNGAGGGTAGDNVWNGTELPLFSNTEGPASDVLGGKSYPLYTPETGAMPGNTESYIGLYWCYGDITVGDHTLSCDGTPVSNMSQTDSMSADLSFYVEQARNNSGFTCPTPEGVTPDTNGEVVTQEDLALDSGDLALNPSAWFFYNDTNDTIMTIDQFSGNGGEDHMDSVAGAEGAKMTLDDASSRYNIATYKYKDVKLSDIDSLSYRIYDDSASPETPYLHFNVDFNNSDTWQNRLVMVPTGVSADTWTTVDAINGGNALWTYSGAFWPAGGSETGTTPGTTAKTWASVLADYPNAETRSTDSFLGVRVGHPGPDGETGYVDWIEVDGETTDFKI
jgi:predicted ribosomally synthesized peptide with SipW-like signal peptide